MRQIMYIGLKPTRRDNINDNPNRVWPGLGAILEVSDVEAKKLVIVADAFLDVTEMNEELRTAAVEKSKEKLRQNERTARGGIVTLAGASEDELREELRRRNKAFGIGKQVDPSELTKGNQIRELADEKEARERPSSTDDLIADIVGVIVSLDSENTDHFDAKGLPRIEAIVKELGYHVEQAEVDAAVAATK